MNKKRFYAYFTSSASFFLSILVAILLMKFINFLVDIEEFINNYGMVVAFIIGGYLMNLFAFLLIHKKWNDFKKI